MDWDIGVVTFSVISLAVLINTSLFVGFSLVEVNLKKVIKRIIFMSLFAGIVFELLGRVFPSEIILIITYIFLLPVSVFYLRVSFPQSIVAILLGLTFNLVFVQLFEYNIFDLLVLQQINKDLFIENMFHLFVLMNNIFICIVFYQRTPILFPGQWFKMLKMDDEQTIMYKVHLLFVILILISMNTFFFYTYIELSFFRTPFRVFVIFWTVILCGLLIFLLRNTLNYQVERTQFFLDKQYQHDLYSFYKVIRSQRHDFNLHLNAIYGLIKNRQYEESNKYIEDIVEDAQHINELLPIKHPAVGAMLNTLSELATQKGVKVDLHIMDDLKDNPCSVYETNKILGNLVKNAIEAVLSEADAEKLVELIIKREHEQIVVKVTNDTSLTTEELNNIFEIGYSTKPNHEGIGLPSIESILANYNGVIFPEVTDGKLTMNVRIPIIG